MRNTPRTAAAALALTHAAALADAPILTRQPVDQRAWAGEKIRLASGATSPLPMTFTWQKDGQPLTGASQSFLDLDNAQPSDSGTYQMTARNADGVAWTRVCDVRILLPELRPGIPDAGFFPGTISQGDVLTFATDGTDCWIGGSFESINGRARPFLAKLDASGTPVPAFNPGSGPNDDVHTVVPHGNGVLVGGEFTTVSGRQAQRLVRLDRNGSLFPLNAPATDRLAAFAFANGPVSAILPLPDGRIAIAGGFSSVNGQPASRMAMLQADGSLAPGFTPPPCNADVRTIVRLGNGTLLLGGNFTSPRVRLLRINADTGTEVPFPGGHAAPDGEVRAMAVQSDGAIVLGGEFTRLFNTDRKHLGRLLTTGALDPDFRANVTGTLTSGGMPRVYALRVDATNRIIAGGSFTAVKGVPRPGLARLTVAGAVDPAFIPPVFSRPVRALEMVPGGAACMVGGEFDWPRTRLLKVLCETPPSALPHLLVADAGHPPAAGGTVSLGAVFRTAAPVSYQWWKDGAPLHGKNRRELFLDAAAPADAGSYRLEAVSTAGSATSPPLPLAVLPPPVAGVREHGFPAPVPAPVNIPEGNTVDSILTISAPPVIDKLAVRLDIRHPDTSQLFAQLAAPNGQSFTLFSQPGRGGADFDQTILDSEAPFTLDERAAPWLGSVRPITNLAVLAGQNAAGTWKLRLQDLRPDDGLTGQLLGWTLLIRTHEVQSFAAWSAALPAGSLRGPHDDADADGLVNFLECAFAGEPPRWAPSADGTRLLLSYTRWSKFTGYQMLPQSSANLINWLPASTPRFDVKVQERRPDGTEHITVSSLPDAGKAFLRLRVAAE